MPWWKRSQVALFATLAFALAFWGWTLLLPGLGWLDDLWRLAPPEPESPIGQILAATSIATSPGVVFIALMGITGWASRRRLFAASGAITLAFALSWSLGVIFQSQVERARPETPFDYLITHLGNAYPSVHIAVWTMTAIMLVALQSTMRRSVWPWIIAGGGVVGLLAVADLWLGHSQVSDIVGGVLLAGMASSVASLIADVHVVRLGKEMEAEKTAAVIYNPAKVIGIEMFNELVERTLAEHGYKEPLWLNTTKEDPGVAMAHSALKRHVDLVLVAGGDGTVRVVLGELADTGMPVAILPSGTGNLLARNLDIPLDLERAMLLAVTGDVSPTDLIEVTFPDHTEYAAVLAGVGIDADIMGDTNEDLKKAIGPAAYIVAGAKHLRANPMNVRLTVDQSETVEAEASLVSVGNVGELQQGVSIIPDASAHDGKLDVLVATPHSTLDMAQMITDVLTEAKDGPNLARYSGGKLRLEIEGGAMCQIDGDVVGEVDDVTFQVRPGAVALVLPDLPLR